ncbi:MAG TPA: PDZ domain-containing protein [Terriglobales bacterium]|nr:PDZ domain-containing protein [Terriglobales bacterium]
MRKSIIFILSFLLVATCAAWAVAFQPSNEAYGFSSDDFFGGSSYLGVDTRDVTPDRLSDLKLKEEHGVEVTTVDQDAPAGKAGIKEHDVILSVNGTAVESVEQLRRMIHEIPPGRMVTLGISRNGQPLTFKAQLADRKKTFAMGPNPKPFRFAMPAVPAIPAMPAMPAMPMMPDMDVPVSVVVVHSSTRSGLMVENLTPQLGDFFGAKNGQGVLVRSVEKGSRAEKAGFHAGDVIVRVNTETINDVGDFSHALNGRKDNTAAVSIIRDKKPQTLSLTLPDRKRSDLFEESFELPEIDAETRINLSQVQSEIARVRPQIALAVRQATRTATKELCKHKQELKKQGQEIQKQLLNQQRELQDELRIELKGLSEI